ncbi:MAG: DUF4149 domain-containing protein [Rhodoferax sp.]|uniref:DUF4149 domain-containing protein n=1 Tax=Rhodoferax sp. TaxID=50421 RepID=UPI002638812E|nr:DUF4149 domain-containing protein [Rhodoferax sp.]MDD2882134.1 DUF4149 domain-containing protein [Rhodoferax sp.]
MLRGLSALTIWAAALWWGALTTVGTIVVPMLFANLPSPAIAGAMAAKLFSAMTWLALGCGLLLLMIFRSNQPVALNNKAQGTILFIALGVLLALLSEFAIAPRIIARQDLRLWHSVGTAMFVGQWLCAGLTFWKLAERSSEA